MVHWKQSFATRGGLNLFPEAAVILTIYVVDVDRRRSISGVVFTLRENTISWRSSLQRVVVLSTTKAEYMVLDDRVKEAYQGSFVAQRSVKRRLWAQIEECVEVFCDSQSDISLSKNNVHNEKTNH